MSKKLFAFILFWMARNFKQLLSLFLIFVLSSRTGSNRDQSGSERSGYRFVILLVMNSLEFLGTGTSQGVPIIGCHCPVCQSTDFHDKRLRTSALVSTPGLRFVIDAGPDFRYQMLRAGVEDIDAILLTHPHRDHVGGLDDVRPFNYYQKRPMPVYGNAITLKALRTTIPYAFAEHRYPGAPEFSLYEVDDKPFRLGDLEIQPFEVLHYKLPITAYRIGPLVYVTDAKFVSRTAIEIMKGCKILVVNALRKEPHLSHFSLDEALALIGVVKPEQAYLTHLGHTLGYAEISAELPEHVHLAYDGLKIEF